MIIISLGGIIGILIVVGTILFIGYYLLALIAAAIVGAGNAGEGIAQAIKKNKFYKHCIQEGMTGEKYTIGKVNLIGQYYKINNPVQTFVNIYIYKHPDEYPEEAKKIRAERSYKNSLWLGTGVGTIIGAVSGVILYAIAVEGGRYHGFRSLFHMRPNDTGVFLFILIMCAILGAVLGLCFILTRRTIRKKKQEKQDMLNKIKKA